MADQQPNGSDDKAEAELAAMSTMRKALASLDEDSRQRVMDWVSDYYGYSGRRKPAPPAPPRPNPPGNGDPDGGGDQPQQYPDFAALYHAANPQTDWERAMVGGYWFQVVPTKPDFGSREVNKALNNLGHKVANITNALTAAINQRPQPVIQVGKAGKAQQANKRYRITDEGIRRVQRMLATGNAEE
jgi:hypothetical protein